MKFVVVSLVVLLCLLAFIGAIALTGWLVMFCWNFVCPKLFHLPVISFWEGVALGVLSSALLAGARAVVSRNET